MTRPEELDEAITKEMLEEYQNVIGWKEGDPHYSLVDYRHWLERRVVALEGQKRRIHRDDQVIYAGKLWRVDWCEGSTLGISNTAGDHKEIGEGAVRLLSDYFRERTIEEIMP